MSFLLVLVELLLANTTNVIGVPILGDSFVSGGIVVAFVQAEML
ncbi:MAG: hypothetical protein ABGY41_20145 [Candidatus Poribacteria bacterium]